MSDRSATAVCKAGWSDCGGLATVYVSILRANGIPGPVPFGRDLGRRRDSRPAEFYAEGVGWVPAIPQ